MPAKSPKQYRFMQGIKHGMKPYGGVGPSPAVASEFVEKTPKNKRHLWSRRKD